MQALESFRRNRILDSATSDDDKVTPVYKLEEVCEMVLASNSDIVREMVEYIMKNRLENNKSPYVKQKALRLVKFSLPKAGKDFRREVQKHSSTIRNLFHFRGQPDALKGDAPNKAVRDMAHEAIQALYNQEEVKPSVPESSGRKMQAFGNTMDRPSPADNWRNSGISQSSFSSVMERGSESIKQGISIIRDAAGQASTSLGSNRGQSLHKSLTSSGSDNQYEGRNQYKGPEERNNNSSKNDYYGTKNEYFGTKKDYGSKSGSFRGNEEAFSGSGGTPWETKSSFSDVGFQSNGQSGFQSSNSQREEERIVEAITQVGGVRVQPSREALQSFVHNVSKLDGVSIGVVLENKLRVHIWQVRFKAMCLLEAILRNEGDPSCDTVCRFFREDASAIIDCLESPQSSLREKSKRVLELLGVGEDESRYSEEAATAQTSVQEPPPPPPDLPDLLDTTTVFSDSVSEKLNSGNEVENLTGNLTENLTEISTESSFAHPDLLGGDFWSNGGGESGNGGGESLGEGAGGGGSVFSNGSNVGDPFMGMSVHSPSGPGSKGGDSDLFSGLQMDAKISKSGTTSQENLGGLLGSENSEGGGLFEGLSVSSSDISSKGEMGSKPGNVNSLANIMGSYPSIMSTGNTGNIGNNGNNGLNNNINSGFGSMGQIPLPPTGPMGGVQMMMPGGVGVGGLQSPNLQNMGGLPMPRLTPQEQQMFFQQQLLYMQAMGMGIRPVGAPGMMGGGGFGHPGLGSLGVGMGMGSTFPTVGGVGGGGVGGGGNVGSMPTSRQSDGFDFSGDPTTRFQPPTEVKKEETKAFDFVADHLKSASTLGQKKGSALKS